MTWPTKSDGWSVISESAPAAWVALYYWSLMVVLALACAIPHRPVLDIPVHQAR